MGSARGARTSSALELLGDGAPTGSRARVLAGVSNFLALEGDQEAAIRVGREALAAAELHGLEEVRADVLTTIGGARAALGDDAGVRRPRGEPAGRGGRRGVVRGSAGVQQPRRRPLRGRRAEASVRAPGRGPAAGGASGPRVPHPLRTGDDAPARAGRRRVGRVRSARGRVHRRVRGGRAAHLAGVRPLSPREHQAGTRRPGGGGRRRRARTRARARGADTRPRVPVAGVRRSRVRRNRRARARARARVRVRLPHARRQTPTAGVGVHPLRLGGGGRRRRPTSWTGCLRVSSGRRAGCWPRVPSSAGDYAKAVELFAQMETRPHEAYARLRAAGSAVLQLGVQYGHRTASARVEVGWCAPMTGGRLPRRSNAMNDSHDRAPQQRARLAPLMSARRWRRRRCSSSSRRRSSRSERARSSVGAVGQARSITAATAIVASIVGIG